MSSLSCIFSIFQYFSAIIFSVVIAKKTAKIFKFTYNSRFLIKTTRKQLFATRRSRRIPEKVANKMAAVQGYPDVTFTRGSNLSCHLRKAPRTCQRAFNDENKNNCKGKMFWLICLGAGLSVLRNTGCVNQNNHAVFVEAHFHPNMVPWRSTHIVSLFLWNHSNWVTHTRTTRFVTQHANSKFF